MSVYTGKTYSNLKATDATIDRLTTGSLVLPTATSAELGDKDDAVNTVGKVEGTVVFDTDTSTLMVAVGDGATDEWWVATEGADTGAITPA